jgi:hypothetical protein
MRFQGASFCWTVDVILRVSVCCAGIDRRRLSQTSVVLVSIALATDEVGPKRIGNGESLMNNMSLISNGIKQPQLFPPGFLDDCRLSFMISGETVNH